MIKGGSCTFTGHRPGALPWGANELAPQCLALKARLAQAVERAYDDGYRHFICGMARGADFYFCEAVLALQKKRGDILLEAAVPCVDQPSRWCRRDRERYRWLIFNCDIETLIQEKYDEFCLKRRNIYMVDHAERIIAVFNGSPRRGGTLSTLHYAMQKGLETDILEI